MPQVKAVKDIQGSDIVLSTGTLKEQVSTFTEEQLQQIIMQANQWAAFVRQMQWMDDISRDIKKIPELPSEIVKPRDTNPITRVEYPDEGGVLTYMENFEYPFQGYPHHDFVDKIDSVKKFSRQMMSGFYHQLKDTSRIKLLTLIPGAWISKNMLRSYVYTLHRIVERFIIKPERYCKFIRELHRAFSIERPGETESETDFRIRLRDTTCMILEFDNAYRFRAQDVLFELDKESLRKNTCDEILRLLQLMSSREHQQEVKDTWRLFRAGILGYLNFDRNLKRMIVHVLGQLDLTRVELTDGDKEYCYPRTDYTFGFKIHPTAKDLEALRKWRTRSEWWKERDRVWEESTKDHQELFKRQNKEAEELTARLPQMPKEEREKTEARLREVSRKYNEEVQGAITEMTKKLQGKYQPEHEKLVSALSHPEVSSLYQKHLEERQAMDKKYMDQLKEAEEKYKAVQKISKT